MLSVPIERAGSFGSGGIAALGAAWTLIRNPAGGRGCVQLHAQRQARVGDRSERQGRAKLEQYTEAGSTWFAHDANGNLIADGTSVFLYGVENRLVERRVQGVGNSDSAALSYAGAREAGLRHDPLRQL